MEILLVVIITFATLGILIDPQLSKIGMVSASILGALGGAFLANIVFNPAFFMNINNVTMVLGILIVGIFTANNLMSKKLYDSD